VLRGRVHYAWLIVLVTFVTLITTAGFRATPGVLIVPLQDEFGWSRATISLAVSIGLVLYGLASPFSAALMERFGVRRVMLVALATVAGGAALATLVRSPWQLDLLWGVVVGGATGAVAVPLAATIANRWFEQRRGLVTGLLTASNASGQMVFLPLLALLVTSFGWRSAALAVSAVAVLVVVPVVALAMRDRPQSVGLLPYGATEAMEPPPRPERPSAPRSRGSPSACAPGTSGFSPRRSSSAGSRRTG
jgi:MFS family permease